MNGRNIIRVAALSALGSFGAGFAQAATWTGASGAAWNTPGNWDVNDVPNTNTEQAVIDGSQGGASLVDLDGQVVLQGLTVASGYTVESASGSGERRLTFNTTSGFLFNNAGTITANSGAEFSLIFTGATYHVTNSGTIQADGTTNAGSSMQIFEGSGNSLYFDTGGTIRTLGVASMSLAPQADMYMNNGGTISNNAQGTMTSRLALHLNNTTLTNDGTFTATNYGADFGAGIGVFNGGAGAFTNSGTFTFNNGLNVTNANRSANYRLTTALATGSFNNSGTIKIIMSEVPGASVTPGGIVAQLQVYGANGAESTLTNTGTINIISESEYDGTINPYAALTTGTSGMILHLHGTGGVVRMSVAANTNSYNNTNAGHSGDVRLARIESSSGHATLINDSGQTIAGAGQLGNGSLILTNDGTVNADDATYAMTIAPYTGSGGKFDNNALVRASAGGGLVLASTGTGAAVHNNNASGTIQVDNGSSLTIGTGSATNTTTLNNYGALIVNGTLSVQSDGAFVMKNGGSISGSGSIGVNLGLNSTTQTVAPGNSPGALALTASQDWSGATYEWQVNDWNNQVAGTNDDQINITGDLTLSGNYTLDVLSLMANSTAGNVGAGGGNSFSESNRSWTILTTTGTISGFNPGSWIVDATGFTDSDAGTWTVDINGTNNGLVLSYSAVPEPATLGLMGLASVGLLLRRRRNGTGNCT